MCIEPVSNRFHVNFLETQDILFLKVIKKYRNELSITTSKMEELMRKGIEIDMINSLPFRKSTIRYLKYLINKVDTSANNSYTGNSC